MLSWRDRVELSNLLERGWSIAAIAKHTGRDPKTIRRFRDNPDLIPGTRRSGPRLVDDYVDYIDARLGDNEHLAGTVLLRESQIWATPAPTRPWPGTCKRFGPTARSPGASPPSR